MGSSQRNDRTTQDDAVAELRSLLVGPERAEIERLTEKLEGPRFLAEETAGILSEAIELRQKSDDSLPQVLSPTVEKALYTSVERDPQTLADALFPVIGPAIRRAVATAMRGFVQGMNRGMDSWLSPRGLRWRMEAWRTGRSYGEVVLRHSLLYRIEQVFLIHRESGLVVHHVVADDTVAQDPDLVSGMLTAIQSFVHDSFEVDEGDRLETLEVGEVSVWLEPGPHAVLAAVIRGTPPSDVRDVMYDALAGIHREWGEELASFDGDSEGFELVRGPLENCLVAEFADESEAAVSPTVWILGAVLLLVVAIWAFFGIRDNIRWSRYVDALRSEPGLVVLDESREDGKFVVHGLRDPLAADPWQILEDSPLQVDDVRAEWRLFQSVDSAFVLARAARLLEPPEGVRLRLEAATLVAEGPAPARWVTQARALSRALPGVERLEVMADVTAIEDALESIQLRFIDGSRLSDEGRAGLGNVVTIGTELREYATAAGRKLTMRIVGHADPSGTPELNRRLSQQRAESVLVELRRAGLPPADEHSALTIVALGAGSTRVLRLPDGRIDAAGSRRVTFELEDAADRTISNQAPSGQ